MAGNVATDCEVGSEHKFLGAAHGITRIRFGPQPHAGHVDRDLLAHQATEASARSECAVFCHSGESRDNEVDWVRHTDPPVLAAIASGDCGELRLLCDEASRIDD